MYKCIFLPKAYQEFFEAWEWYEQVQIGLGDRFRNELFKTVQIIANNPVQYAIRKSPYREALIEVFPYLIIYQVIEKKNKIAIVSVFHSSRNPIMKY